MENKVEFGLKNVHYAPYTETNGTITYETPVRIPGAVSLTTTPRGELTEFYADDIHYYVSSSNDGYDGTLTIALVPEQFAIDALGEELDSTDKVLNEFSNAKGKPFALMFEFDGDVKATRHVLYSCTVSRPGLSSSTKTNTKEANTTELTLIASPKSLVPNAKSIVKTKTTPATPAAVYDAWYTSVYKKTPAV
jgi:phi13 family phage major tail protein